MRPLSSWSPYALLFCVACVFSSPTLATDAAQEAASASANAVTEKRLQTLASELRCLVCQNQTIADSNAELAVDLRREVRSMIDAGQTDSQIIQFMVNRYGDFVLYRPPVKGMTLVLWGGPLLLMLIGLFALFRYVRQRQKRLEVQAPLSATQSEAAESLLRTAPTAHASKD